MSLGQHPCPVFLALPALRSPEPPGQLREAALPPRFTRSATLTPNTPMLSGPAISAVC